MSTIAFLSITLEKITNNMDSFENDQNITNMINIVSNIGSFLIENCICLSLLKSVLSILAKFHDHSSRLFATKKFYCALNKFYCTKKICSKYKLLILSSFAPAVEFEVLSLLKICSELESPFDFSDINIAMLDSCLPNACTDNPNIYNKVICILKRSFILSKGNPAVGYLSFMFNKAVRSCAEMQRPVNLFSENFIHLELLLPLPKYFITEEQKIVHSEQLIATIVESAALKLCHLDDLIFLLPVFPSFYHQVLTLYMNEDHSDALKLLKIIWHIPEDYDVTNFKETMCNILLNPLWKNLLES